MIFRCVVGTKAECDRVAQLCNQLFAYPSNSTRLGGGVHVPTAAAQTLRYSDVRPHPTLSSTFCLPLTNQIATALAGLEQNNLSAAEQAELAAADGGTSLVDFPDSEDVNR